MTSRTAHTRDEVLAFWHPRDLTDGLSLQPLQERHAERFVELVGRNQAEIGAWANWVWSPFGADEAVTEIQRLAPGEHGPWSLPFAIERDNTMIGFAHIFAIRFVLSIADIGYWIDHDEAGRGITTTAVRSLCSLAFDEMGIHRVELRCSPDNHGSMGIARKAGFTIEGLHRDAWRVKDQPQSLVMHSRLATDPSSAAARPPTSW
ncbi:GNAT family protein [Luteococcus sp. H138]|uniref:GNAT family N-acetyltransferase n=1 Tax=unclassified Luteococcus TaxID=2639923 RepID=UPI00313B7425